MRTFIWADENLFFTDYQFFIAHADNLDEARLLLKHQLELDLEARIKKVNEQVQDLYEKDLNIHRNQELWLNYIKKEHERIISSIFKTEPTHILSSGMAVRIHYAP
jgi:chromosome segregation and condensation protein ScpB